MRFGDLEGLTSLPIKRIRRRFRNEDILTVLPVSGAAQRDSVLVATSPTLAVLTSDAGAKSGLWMTQWAPWDAVSFSEDDDADDGLDDDNVYRLTIHVGRLTFVAQLAGPRGQRALRDFVVAAQTQRRVSATP